MSDEPLRVLVIDAEYLVALDAEQILVDALSCDVTIATPRMSRAILQKQQFDVVLVDTGYGDSVLASRLATVERSGCALAFSTFSSSYRAGVPGFEQVPVVFKPFEDKQLIAAIRGAVNPFHQA